MVKSIENVVFELKKYICTWHKIVQEGGPMLVQFSHHLAPLRLFYLIEFVSAAIVVWFLSAINKCATVCD